MEAEMIRVLFLLVAVLAAPASAATYLVTPDGGGDFAKIQDALDAAVPGDFVELADGVYTGARNRDLDYGGKGITLRSRNRNPAACVIDCQGSLAEPHRGVLFQLGEPGSAVLEGVTITGGHTGTQSPSGGAILCTNASAPRLVHCIFSGNRTWTLGAGGAIAADASSPVVEDCRFAANWAYFGGGVFASGAAAPELRRCTFEEHTGIPYGAAACFWGGATPVLEECAFSGNSALFGGALYCADVTTATLTGCRFEANEATGTLAGVGGALYLTNVPATFEVRNCLFKSNAAAIGGALALEGALPTIAGCRFEGNVASAGGGAVYCNLGSSPRIDTCWFISNRAPGGGAITIQSPSAPVLVRDTFYGNAADNGGSIRLLPDAACTLENVIIALGAEGAAVSCATGAALIASCCDIHGNSGGDWSGCLEDQAGVSGNISLDPLFCDPANGDFSVRADSPCAPFSPPNPECDQIGASPVGCTPPTPTKVGSWGRLKTTYTR
jgi:predicted outer membrane repeat protein